MLWNWVCHCCGCALHGLPGPVRLWCTRFFHSFIRSFVHSFIPSFLSSFLHSFIPSSFIPSFPRSFLHSCIPAFPHSCIDALMHSRIHAFMRSLFIQLHAFSHSFIESILIIHVVFNLFRRRATVQRPRFFSPSRFEFEPKIRDALYCHRHSRGNMLHRNLHFKQQNMSPFKRWKRCSLTHCFGDNVYIVSLQIATTSFSFRNMVKQTLGKCRSSGSNAKIGELWH